MTGPTNATHNCVWVPNKKDVFRKASIVASSLENSTVQVRYEDGTEDTVPSDSIGEVNPSKFDKADDIAELTFLNEGSVLHNLETRYKDDMIYTYSGLFLVAINPYTKLPIYSEDYINMYHNVPKAESKPHIFAETDQAYQNLLAEKRDQSILVTGESGAGKTENTKRIITYLAAVTSKHNSGSGSFEQQIIQANPILEAFGNAQTVRNNNSSRFGKFIKIEFDGSGKIAGAHIDWYLLEKSRVVQQSKQERNYHIFYQLLSGLSQKELDDFGLEKSPSKYSYLKEGNFQITGIDDSKEFKILKSAFEIMGIKKEQYVEVFKVIAIILHIGNIEFVSMKAEQASFKTAVDKLSELLGVEQSVFTDAIVRPKVRAGNELIKQSRNATQARFSLDALAKSLFEKVFKYLVDSINTNLDHGVSNSNFIGVLDIAGFEIFKDNSFEQLCINYTNEKLQQFFNHHMFVLEQNEYMKEDINWKFIDFGQDLQQTIDLIEKRTDPVGVFSILDEECIVPKSTDTSFFEKLNKYCNKKSEKFKPSKFHNKFSLKHYAGDVEYSVEGWVNKNRDPLADSVLDMLSKSSNSFIADLYPEVVKKSGSSFRTVSQKHKEQLNDLVNLLSQTHPHFVRCILPNTKKKPQIFDKKLVLEQLKCNGVLEGIRIVRSGFPNRIFFKEFYDRYRILAPKTNFTKNMKTNSQMILSSIDLDSEMYRAGSTKVFFKAGVLADLELKRDQLIQSTFTEFNSICRGVLKRSIMKKKVLKVQASQVLMEAFKTYNKMNENPWYTLLSDLKPLLESSQHVDKIKQTSDHIKSLEKKLQELESRNSEMEEKHSAALEKRNLSIEESRASEKELKSKLKASDELITSLGVQRDELKTSKESLNMKVNAFELDLTKGQELIKVLQNEKNQLDNQIKDLEFKLKESETSQQKNAENYSKVQEELKMLKALLKAKDDQINDLNERLSKSDEKLKLNLDGLNAKYVNANSQIKKLLEENKTLLAKMKTLQESSSQYGSVVSKKEQDIEHMKELLVKQSYQIKQLQAERESLKMSKTTVDAQLKSEMSDLETRYKQLEQEAKEAKDLLQRKITDEITFNRGKQKYDSEIVTLKVELAQLKKKLDEEKASKVSLFNEIRELKSENESYQNDRKINDVRSAQGAFRSKSLNNGVDSDIEKIRDDKDLLIREYARMKLQLNENSAMLKKETIEKTRLKADMKLLHTRLASETFDRQQLKIKLNRVKESLAKGESPIFDENEGVLVQENKKLHHEVESLKMDLDLERKASLKSQNMLKEISRNTLKNSSNTYNSPFGGKDADNFKTKYEESQAKLRFLERKVFQESQKENQTLLNSNNSAKLDGNVLQPRHGLDNSRSQAFRLNSGMEDEKDSIANNRTKDTGLLSNQLAREELGKANLKLQAIESKNVQLTQSVKLYQARAEEYFSKLENAEVAIRNSKHAEKFSIERLNEAKKTIDEMKKDIQAGETASIKLSTTISQLKEEIQTRDAELSKLYSSNRFLQEEVHHYQDRLEKEVPALKARLEGKVNNLTDSLTESLRNETDLRKTLGSLEVEYNRLKEQKRQEINDLIKEKTFLSKRYNEVREENESAHRAQQDLEIKLRSLMKQVTTLSDSVGALVAERDQLQAEKRNLENRVGDLSGEYSKFENESDLRLSQIEQLNSSLDQYETEVEKLKIEIKKINASKEQLNAIIDDERQKNIIVKEENQSLGKFTETLKDRINELEELTENMKHDEVWMERVNKLEKSLKIETDMRVHSEKAKNNLERSVEELKDEVDRQHKKINEFEDVKTKYELKISELFNAINKWQSADSQSKLIIKRAEREIRHLQENAMELENELNDWKEKFDSISTKKRTLVTDEVFM